MRAGTCGRPGGGGCEHDRNIGNIGIGRTLGPAARARRFEPRRRTRGAGQRPARHLRGGGRRPLAWWDEQAERLTWDHRWDRVLDWDLPFAKWFVGGRLNAGVQLRRPSRGGRAGRPGGLPLGRRARGRHPHHHLRRPAEHGVPGGQRPGRARGEGRRPGGHLHADDPRGGGGHAGLRPAGRPPLGGLRRLLGRGAGRPHPRRRRPGGDHRRRRLPAGRGLGR